MRTYLSKIIHDFKEHKSYNLLMCAFLVCSACCYALPKHKMMTLVFTFSLLGDAWLNYWIKAHREQLPQKVCRVFLQILYVSTACLVVMCVCFLILPLPFEDWTPFWKTYPIGVIIIFICLKIILSGVFFLQYGCSRIPALKSQASPKHWFQAGLWAVVLAFGIMVYGTVYEAFNLRVQREGITDKSIPESFGGYKIVQLSDLHIGSQISEQYTRKVVDSINAQNPDLVVFTGDMLNLHTDEMRPFVSLLSEIRAKDGIYAILGNHDYGGYLRWESQKDSMDNIQGLLNIYQSLNWQVLQNAHTVLYRGQDSIVLAGVDDYSSKKSKRRHSFADTKKALSGTSQSDFIVMLSHNPQHFEEELQTDYPHVNLTLSGHSHGGQMSVGIGEWRFSAAQLSLRYWGGLHQKDNQVLNVNTGCGFNVFPFRIGMSPAISVITLLRY